MPRVLTVDDSRAVRSIITRQLKELNFEIEEAEDGQQGLDKLEEVTFDLVLLDVTMPVMDGPTMLEKLRARGDKTPVIMLTSESKRSIVSGAMKLGINDYILKPFKPEELLGKIRSTLKLPALAPAAAATPEAASKPASDVVVIDDMENVAKRLRSLLPAHVTMSAFTSAPAALTASRDRAGKVFLIDTEMPDTDSAVLAGQLKALQPGATFLALALKTPVDPTAALRAKGFADVVFKPFSPEAIEDFVSQYFDKQDLLLRADNVITVGAFTGRDDRLERYFSKLSALLPAALEQVAAACYEGAIIDLSKVSVQADKLPRLMVSMAEKAAAMGLTVRLVAPPEVKRVLGSFEETRKLPTFVTVDDALAQAA